MEWIFCQWISFLWCSLFSNIFQIIDIFRYVAIFFVAELRIDKWSCQWNKVVWRPMIWIWNVLIGILAFCMNIFFLFVDNEIFYWWKKEIDFWLSLLCSLMNETKLLYEFIRKNWNFFCVLRFMNSIQFNSIVHVTDNVIFPEESIKWEDEFGLSHCNFHANNTLIDLKVRRKDVKHVYIHSWLGIIFNHLNQ